MDNLLLLLGDTRKEGVNPPHLMGGFFSGGPILYLIWSPRWRRGIFCRLRKILFLQNSRLLQPPFFTIFFTPKVYYGCFRKVYKFFYTIWLRLDFYGGTILDLIWKSPSGDYIKHPLLTRGHFWRNIICAKKDTFVLGKW